MAVFFGGRPSNFERVINPLLEDGILEDDDGKLSISDEAIGREFQKTGGREALSNYIERISGETATFERKGIAANDQRSEAKIKAALEGTLNPEELTAYEKRSFKERMNTHVGKNRSHRAPPTAPRLNPEAKVVRRSPMLSAPSMGPPVSEKEWEEALQWLDTFEEDRNE